MAAGLSFAVALVIVLLGTPVARRVALARGVVDHPADRKLHVEPTPYLGGIPIILGSAVGGIVIHGGVNRHFTIAVIAAALVGLLGLADDVREVPHLLRLAVESLAAAVVVAAGVRLQVSGLTVIDVGLTLVWVVGITNAVNFLDNMDGLAGGVAAAAAAGTFVLAAAADGDMVARIAAALAGACLGFLAYNKRPASIFMGDAGSLFLGFLLAVAVLGVDPARPPPASFAIPFLLLALPVLDTTVVTLARLRRGRAVHSPGKDHLSHRLVARGASPGHAALILIATELALATLAVLTGRDLLALPQALGSAALLLGTLAWVVIPAPVHHLDVVGIPRRLKLVVLVALAVPAGLSIPAVVAMTLSLGPAESGRARAEAAVSAANAGDYGRASALFADARRRLDLVDRRLHAPLVSLGLTVPGISSNLRATRVLAEVGGDLASAGRNAVVALDRADLAVRDGGVSIDALRGVQPVLDTTQTSLARAQRRMAQRGFAYLLPPVKREFTRLRERLGRLEESTSKAAEAARVVPRVLGAEGSRRYLVAVGNTAELRSSGGRYEAFGELVAEDGKLRLDRFGPMTELERGGTPVGERTIDLPSELSRRVGGDLRAIASWDDVNISPDFPTIARMAKSLYPQSTGSEVDGVIGLDPAGLRALLALTGPVEVGTWPEPLSADNVVRVTTQEQFRVGATPGVAPTLLEDTAQTVLRRVLQAALGEPDDIGRALGPPARRGHIQLWLARPAEDHLARRLGLGSEVPDVRGDALLLVNHSEAGNNVDAFLQRDITYRVRLEPRDDGTARVEADLDAVFMNGAASHPPATSDHISTASVYTPLRAGRTLVDGEPEPFTVGNELGRRVYTGQLQIPAGGRLRMQMALAGAVQIDSGGWYRLDLLHQPTSGTDRVRVVVEVPRGWRIAESRSFTDISDRSVAASGPSSGPRHFAVRLVPDGFTGLWRSLSD